MSEIRIDKSAFEYTSGIQKNIVEKMGNSYDKIELLFKGLVDAWKGDSGEAFKSTSENLQKELLWDLFELKRLNSQTTAAQELFTMQDNTIANDIKK